MSGDGRWHIAMVVDHDDPPGTLNVWRDEKTLSDKAIALSGNDRRSCLRLELYSMVEEIVEEVFSE